MIRKLTVLLLLGVSSLVFSAELTLTVWSKRPAHVAVMETLIRGFNERHPEVTVQLEYLPYGDYNDLFSSTTTRLPDIGWVSESQFPQLVERGLAIPLMSALQNDERYDLEDYTLASLEQFSHEGQLLAVPFSNSPFVMFYNQDHLNAALVQSLRDGQFESFQTMIEAVSAHTRKQTGVYAFEGRHGGSQQRSRSFEWVNLLIQSDLGPDWQPEGCAFNDEAFKALLNWYRDSYTSFDVTVPVDQERQFFKGSVAVTYGQISDVSQLQTVDFEWGLAPMPQGAEMVGRAGLFVSQHSEHQALAIEFVKYLTGRQGAMVMSRYFPPARASILKSIEFLGSNPNLEPVDMSVVGQGILNGQSLVMGSHETRLQSLVAKDYAQLWNPSTPLDALLTQWCAAP
ncbi:ABC transporter substrate-binding protein [Reinekea blandensis]|uniref:ABC transporter, substrate binding protein (Sugar) n=1 Tax=Reinekea blandensis MED297 TaxID=314283 RepID=A4BAU8_9GAMM|nr:extracellular solute-binding protein [Reinekea blandensis]EAR10561.1 ABC transporter, substrate binding protein (sugar) [Reinekea sp. MED297] [Reinekea blandensis MED297]